MVKKDGGNTADRDGFFAMMFLARIRHEMGDMRECDALLARADISWKENNFKDTDKLFDFPLDGLNKIGTDPWLGLLMNVLIMEFNNLLFPRRYPIQWGMKEALISIKELPLDGPGGDDFHCSLFLATHIIYALGAYQSIKTKEIDCPWLYRYLRVSMRYWMKQSWKLEKQKKNSRIRIQVQKKKEVNALVPGACVVVASMTMEGEVVATMEGEVASMTMATATKDEAISARATATSEILIPMTQNKNNFIYFEIDGVSEIVDTLRGCGLTSASDRLVCEGSLSLLRTQRKDGSWPYWTDHGDGSKDKDCSFYDVLHPTWVAVQGLRDRDFKLDRPASEKWRDWITKVVKQVGFANEPTYDNDWSQRRQKMKNKNKKKKTKKKKKKIKMMIKRKQVM